MNQAGTGLESGYAPLKDTSLYYETLGKGEKVLVFVHGLGLDCRIWDDQFFGLADHYKVVRYDLRGFGKSSLPPVENYAHHTDLFGLLQYLQIPLASLIGLSMGGRVVIDFALTYPAVLSSIVLVDAALSGYSFKTFSIQDMMTTAKESGLGMANQAWLRHELFKPALRQPAVAKRLSQIVSDYSGWHWAHKNPWTALDPPAIQQLGSIALPALVIVGEEDLPDFHSIADILYKNIPASKKIVMKKVGHMSNMEDSRRFNDLLLDFYSAL
jgi:3-oxoadipate enol-lactonase